MQYNVKIRTGNFKTVSQLIYAPSSDDAIKQALQTIPGDVVDVSRIHAVGEAFSESDKTRHGSDPVDDFYSGNIRPISTPIIDRDYDMWVFSPETEE